MPLTIPVENRALRKSPRSSIGSRSRRSCQTNTTPSTPATTNRPTISAEPHPVSAPKEIADSSATTAGKNIPSPVQSKRTRASRFRLRGTSSTAATAPNDAEGHVDEEDEPPPPGRQQQPADVGPSASPSAWAAPWKPMAFPSAAAGTTSTMMARLFACSIAAPTACSARKPHSAARSGASPHSTEATVKIKKP